MKNKVKRGRPAKKQILSSVKVSTWKPKQQ